MDPQNTFVPIEGHHHCVPSLKLNRVALEFIYKWSARKLENAGFRIECDRNA